MVHVMQRLDGACRAGGRLSRQTARFWSLQPQGDARRAVYRSAAVHILHLVGDAHLHAIHPGISRPQHSSDAHRVPLEHRLRAREELPALDEEAHLPDCLLGWHIQTCQVALEPKPRR